jgi:hypothetical protein
MRKILSAAVLIFVCAITNAQELLTKKGNPILPEPKDWSIGVQAEPFLNYTGNLFSKDDNTTSELKPQIPLTLVGLYVKDNVTAYRLKLRIGLGTRTINNFVDDDSYTGLPPNAKTTDTWKHSYTAIAIGAGIQQSRGKGRLRGIYGVEMSFGFNSSTDSYTYGNPFTPDRSDPTSTTDWSQKDTTGNYLSGPSISRTSQVKNPRVLDFTLNSFLGAEYFFAPKISLSAEYGFGFVLAASGEKETFTVSDDNSSGKETSTRNAKSSNFSLDVRDIGAIALHLYF